MQITSIKQTKTYNLIRLLLFIILISFSTSTTENTNIYSNLSCDIILKKLFSGDLSVIENKAGFLISMIEDEINEIYEKKTLEYFNKTLTFRLINLINNNISSNYEVMQMIKINEILDILILKISEISKLYIYDNFFFEESILNLIYIYSNNKKNNLNFENFNNKIIPIINKILDKMNNECKNDINNITEYNFFNDCIDLFKILSKNEIFFSNLKNNQKLKKMFINMIDRYIRFLIKNKKNFIHDSIIINNFFNKFILEIIKSNDSYKKIYFEIIECFLDNFNQIINTETLTTRSNDLIKCFLENLFINQFYFENLNNNEILLNIFKKITDIELNKNKKKVNKHSIYTIKFYIEYIAIIFEKNSKLIRIFEQNINEIITYINSFEINSKHFYFHRYSYYELNNYLYHSKINLENNKFNNPNLIHNLKKCFYEYITKIFIFELDNIDYKVTEFRKNFTIYNLLSKNSIELENYNLKNIISYKVIQILEQFHKKHENQKFLESINFTIKEKNLLKFAFAYKFIDIHNEKTQNLLLKFLKIYYYKVSKSVNNVEDIELYIVLSFYITNLVEKLDMDESSKNNFFVKIKNFTFETEIQEFINKIDGKNFKKLSIVKFIHAIKETDLKILENLEELNKENFKKIMINLIDYFKKLDYFYYKNKNIEFFKIFYKDFMEIFNYKLEKKFFDNDKNKTIIFYWSKNEIRKEIIAYLYSNILFKDNLKTKNKSKIITFFGLCITS